MGLLDDESHTQTHTFRRFYDKLEAIEAAAPPPPMASRNRNNVKIETTIESCRSEAKWQRVIELAEELKTGSPNYGK